MYVGDNQSPGNLASLWDICVLCMQETINLPGIQRHFGIFVYYVMQETLNLPGTQRHFGIFVYYVCRRHSISRVPSVTLGYLCIMYVGDNQSPGYLASLWDICVLCNVGDNQSPGYLASLWDICVLCNVGDNQSPGYLASLWDICVLCNVGDNQSPGNLASLWDICVLCMQEIINLPGIQRHFGIFVYYVRRSQLTGPSDTLGYLCIMYPGDNQPSVTLGYLCIMYVGDNQSPGYLASLWDICVLCNVGGTQRHFGIFVYYVCRRQSISRESSVTLGYLCITYVGDNQSPGNLASLWDICVLCNVGDNQSPGNLASLWDICVLCNVGDNQSPGNLASLWDICVLCMTINLPGTQTLGYLCIMYVNLPGIQRHFGIFVYYVCRRQSTSRESSVTLGYLCIMYVGDNQSPGNLASLWDICVLCMQETINLPGTQRHFGIFVYYVMQETIHLPGIQRHFGIFVYYVCRRQSISRESSVTLGYLCIMYVGDNQSPGNLASLWDICVLCMQETINLPGIQRHFGIFVYYVMQETINLPGIQRHFGIFVYYVYRGHSISRVPSVTLRYL